VVTALLQHWVDTGVILAVVLINAVFGFVQEGRAEKALDAVKAMVSSRANVLRDGLRMAVPAEELVAGDCVLLEAGDRVPADLRLLRASSLKLDEAMLTGESVAVDKSADPVAADAALGDRFSMAYSGTLVAAGQGLGVVVATGPRTELGLISTMLGSVQTLATPLTRLMDRFARQLTITILSLSALMFCFALWVRDYDIADAFIAVVGIAVSAIPEGLPVVMTIALAIGVQRMAARYAIVRSLPAVETLGAVSVICSDKTGTLTRNEMSVRAVVLPGPLRHRRRGLCAPGAFHPGGRGDRACAASAAAALRHGRGTLQRRPCKTCRRYGLDSRRRSHGRRAGDPGHTRRSGCGAPASGLAPTRRGSL